MPPVDVNGSKLAELIGSNEIVVVDFWKTGCVPCMQQARILHTVAEKYPKLPIVKLNIAEHPEAAATFGLMSVPVILVYSKQKETWRKVGLTPMFDIQDAIDAVLDVAQ